MHDLIIIGAGPAGLTAALYAGRYRLNTLILEKMTVGGQIILSPTIENYPGFPGGIATDELIEKFKEQVEELNIPIENKEVLEVSLNLESTIPLYNVRTQDTNYEAKSVIIATGARAKRLGVAGEDKLIGRGVSYCGTCDGPLFRNKDIVVVGGGDRAIEEAIFLSGYASKVSLIHRRSQLRASKILEEKARVNPKINFVLNSVIEEILGENKVDQVFIKDVNTGAKTKFLCQGVFVFVGIEPSTNFAREIVETNEKGFIVTDQRMQTSKQGIFACGDCRQKSLYQVVTACGEAAIAADSAHKYIMERR